MMRAKTALASLSLLLTLSLSGCGSDSALTDYTSQMNTFYDAFSSGTLALEQIDPSSETAQEELLSGLDELTALTDSLADISVPKRYADAGIDELAAQAAEHMQEADSLYHEACSAETFDQERASAAQEHYQRAMKRIHYIGIMLQGRTPDDEEITIIHETTDWTGGDLPDTSDGKTSIPQALCAKGIARRTSSSALRSQLPCDACDTANARSVFRHNKKPL